MVEVVVVVPEPGPVGVPVGTVDGGGVVRPPLGVDEVVVTRPPPPIGSSVAGIRSSPTGSPPGSPPGSPSSTPITPPSVTPSMPSSPLSGPSPVTPAACGSPITSSMEIVVPGAASTVREPESDPSSLSPTPSAPAPRPTTAVRAVAPDAPAVAIVWGMNESWVNHDNGPIAIRKRPSETFRKARTMAASNWVPAHLANSARAATGEIGSLYDRADVITSNASVTATILPARLMSVPAIRGGSPDRPIVRDAPRPHVRSRRASRRAGSPARARTRDAV